jgi:hypothetical protein
MTYEPLTDAEIEEVRQECRPQFRGDATIPRLLATVDALKARVKGLEDDAKYDPSAHFLPKCDEAKNVER